MLSLSLLSRRALILTFVLFFLVPHGFGHAEETPPVCKGLRGKELVLCWKKMDPQRARGDHDVWHKEQNALHLKWHQEHRNMTDAQATLDHQKFHQDMTKRHKEFHRGAQGKVGVEKVELEKEVRKVKVMTAPRDVEAAPNRGLSKKRQLRQ